MFALGQQRVEEGAGESFLTWAKDRFPPPADTSAPPTSGTSCTGGKKTPTASARCAPCSTNTRTGCGSSPTAARTSPNTTSSRLPHAAGAHRLAPADHRNSRGRAAPGATTRTSGGCCSAQGLFRTKDWPAPRRPLLTLGRIYDVQYTALEPTCRRAWGGSRPVRQRRQRPGDPGGQGGVAAGTHPGHRAHDLELVARCLYARLDQGNQVEAVQEALEDLGSATSPGTPRRMATISPRPARWEKQRQDISEPPGPHHRVDQGGLKWQVDGPDKALRGARIPLDGLVQRRPRGNDERLVDPLTPRTSPWTSATSSRTTGRKRAESGAAPNRSSNRILWVCGNPTSWKTPAGTWNAPAAWSSATTSSTPPLNPPGACCWCTKRPETTSRTVQAGEHHLHERRRLLPRSGHRPRRRQEHGHGPRTLGDELSPNSTPATSRSVSPGELQQIIVNTDLVGISCKFLPEGLGIFEWTTGSTCPPAAVWSSSGSSARSSRNPGSASSNSSRPRWTALRHVPNVVKTCVAGLLRGSRLTIQPEGGTARPAVRDNNTQDVFEKIQLFNRGLLTSRQDRGHAPAGRSTLLQERFQVAIEHDDHSLRTPSRPTSTPPSAACTSSIASPSSPAPSLARPPRPPGAFEDTLRRLRNAPDGRCVKRHLAALKAWPSLTCTMRSSRGPSTSSGPPTASSSTGQRRPTCPKATPTPARRPPGSPRSSPPSAPGGPSGHPRPPGPIKSRYRRARGPAGCPTEPSTAFRPRSSRASASTSSRATTATTCCSPFTSPVRTPPRRRGAPTAGPGRHLPGPARPRRRRGQRPPDELLSRIPGDGPPEQVVRRQT